MFDGHRNYKISGKAQRDQELVAPFKKINWESLALPSGVMGGLQSLRDKVKNGVRKFPVEAEDVFKPILDRLGISVSFEPVYAGKLDPKSWHGSKLSMEDLLGPPIACKLYIDENNYLKLTNLHF